MSLKLQGLENLPRIRGWRLTAAELLLHLPDYPHVLQSFNWQRLNRARDFPELDRFLSFWQREFKGPIQSEPVAVALTGPIGAEMFVRRHEAFPKQETAS
jgi:uncharacterized protein Usg